MDAVNIGIRISQLILNKGILIQHMHPAKTLVAVNLEKEGPEIARLSLHGALIANRLSPPLFIGSKETLSVDQIINSTGTPKTSRDFFPDIDEDSPFYALTYINVFQPNFNHKTNHPRGPFIGVIGLPRFEFNIMLYYIQKDLNVLHTIFHYFFYPSYGKDILPILCKGRQANLYLGEKHTLRYRPASLSGLILGQHPGEGLASPTFLL